MRLEQKETYEEVVEFLSNMSEHDKRVLEIYKENCPDEFNQDPVGAVVSGLKYIIYTQSNEEKQQVNTPKMM